MPPFRRSILAFGIENPTRGPAAKGTIADNHAGIVYRLGLRQRPAQACRCLAAIQGDGVEIRGEPRLVTIATQDHSILLTEIACSP